MSKPLISVIIPVYNAAATLERCVASVAAQDYPNLEIILINDGSTDASGELCDQIAQSLKTDPQESPAILVIHQDNLGLSGARNTGLKKASGAFVTFLDSDDAIAPEMLSQMYQAMQDFKVKLVACDFVAVPETAKIPESSIVTDIDTTRVTTNDNERGAPKLYSTKECLTQLLLEQDFPIMACGKLYARELFQTVQFPLGKLYEDVGTTYKLVLECDKIVYLPQKFYYYYQNQNSIIHQSFCMAKLDLITLTDGMCDEIIKQLSVKPNTPLYNAIINRRMHARFSILRQLVFVEPQSPEVKQVQAKMVAYLKQHKADILKNPISTRRDRLAMRSLQFGLPVFQLAWKLYKR